MYLKQPLVSGTDWVCFITSPFFISSSPGTEEERTTSPLFFLPRDRALDPGNHREYTHLLFSRGNRICFFNAGISKVNLFFLHSGGQNQLAGLKPNRTETGASSVFLRNPTGTSQGHQKKQ